jgi:hypothetical protein
MTPEKIRVAVGEARRFIAWAKVLLDSRSPDDGPWDGDSQPRLQGSVRRASMDLTRALADMRRVG